MDPLKFLKKKSKLVLDKSMKAYDYVKGKVKAGYTYLVDKKARWRKYYNEIKSYFSPRFLVDAITPSDILDTVKKVTKKKMKNKMLFFYKNVKMYLIIKVLLLKKMVCFRLKIYN